MLNSFYECMLSHFNHVQLFATPWTVALQAPLSMGVSGQEYWRGLPCTSPGDISDLHLLSPALAGSFFTTSATWEVLFIHSSVQMPLLPQSLHCFSLRKHLLCLWTPIALSLHFFWSILFFLTFHLVSLFLLSAAYIFPYLMASSLSWEICFKLCFSLVFS